MSSNLSDKSNTKYLDFRMFVGVITMYICIWSSCIYQYVKEVISPYKLFIVSMLLLVICLMTIMIYYLKDLIPDFSYYKAISILYIVAVFFVVYLCKTFVSTIYIIPLLLGVATYGDFSYCKKYAFISFLLALGKLLHELNFKVITDLQISTYWTIGLVYVFVIVFFIGNAKEQKRKSDILSGISDIAYIDSLSGVHTRAYLNEYLRSNIMMDSIVLLSDINNFKQVNDTYGHDVGDIVIAKYGQILNSVISNFKHAECFRIGGDEFVVIALKTDADDIINAVNIKLDNDIYFASNKYNINVAFGKSKSSLLGSNWEVCYEQADKNMYTNKKKMKIKEI